ncbi:dihydrofolate reductase family protein [Bacteroidales bacterium OttesenSCG-928-J19]|nr:dihydrofolate reductase family protein [Bacteroidales bacterium OttesenSCG-928-J19]
MNKIKIYSFISLDGYMSKMGGDMEWVSEYPSPEKSNYDFDLFYQSIHAAIVNDVYYANLQIHDLYPFGDKEVYLISSQSIEIEINKNIKPIVNHSVKGKGYLEKAKELKRSGKGNIWLAGDHEIISAFMEQGLVDEITLNVIPVTLGSGRPLFNFNNGECGWELENHKVFENGVVQLKYRASV